MSHVRITRLLTTMLVLVTILTVVGHPAHAALTPDQQATANASLIGLWTNSAGAYDKAKAAKVTVAHVKAALDIGADPNAKDRDGLTALMLVAVKGNVNCAKLLVARGADLNEKTTPYVGDTALMLAASRGNVDCARFLVSAGADVNAKDDDGHTALMLDCISGSVDCSKVLALRANINAKDNKGKTALIWAAGFGKIGVVKFLVSKGAHVNAKSDDGGTALMEASQYDIPNHVACIKFLISKDAHVNAKRKDGKTALTIAQGHPDIIAILKSAGAK